MKSTRIIPIVLLGIIILLVTSLIILIKNTSQVQVPSELNRDTFISYLKNKGFSVRSGDSIEQPFFSVRGIPLTVNSHKLQVFEYENVSQVQSEIKNISPDGDSAQTSTQNTIISWIDDPHFFQKDRLIVLYLGKNKEFLNLLSSILGEQKAGKELN